MFFFEGGEYLGAELDAQLVQLSMTEPWASQTPFLIQLPGLGVINALTLLAAIGDITRFASAKKLVGYSGLGAAVHASGQTYQTRRTTKQGRCELRTTMIEAAWVAVEHHPHWKAQFERLTHSIGKRKAIVAIARKLLVAVWHVLDLPGGRLPRRSGSSRWNLHPLDPQKATGDEPTPEARGLRAPDARSDRGGQVPALCVVAEA